jgi:hypothetical protein
MTKYRDLLTEQEGIVVGSAVGCGLDRLNRDVNGYEITAAIEFFNSHKEKIESFPISAQRQIIQEFTEHKKIPDVIKT